MMSYDTYFDDDDFDDDVCVDCGRPVSPYTCATGPLLCPFCLERQEEFLEAMREEMAEHTLA